MLGLSPAVYVADPDAIWSILRNDEGTFSCALGWGQFFFPLELGGPGSVEFQAHRDVRKLLQPAFGAPALTGYLAAAEEIYDATITRWLQQKRIGFKAEVRRLFATVSARIFMGIEDPDEAARLDRALVDGWQALLSLWRRSALSFGWRRARRGLDALWAMINRHHGTGDDLLARLRRSRDEANWLDDDHTRLSQIIGVLFGAFDTTSSGATSMAYVLATKPEWQEQLRAEAQALDKPRPTPDDLKALEIQERVWKETLRLYPVAGQPPRQTMRETTICGQRIPAGAFMMVMVATAMRDPKFWTRPLEFDPDRFSAARAEDKKHKAIYLPFGAGAHACIGAQLAGLEIKAFWNALLRRCRFKLAKPYVARHTYTPLGMVSGDVALELEPI
jgi:cytochrome P450